MAGRALSAALLGVWIIASAAVFPLLELPMAEAAGLRWSLILAGYCFATAVILQAATGVRAFSPEGGILTKIAFAANLGAILTSFLAVALTLIGAAKGLRADKHSARADRASDSTRRVGPSA